MHRLGIAELPNLLFEIVGSIAAKGEKKMSYMPVLILHISGGTLGLISGGAAAFLRKGSPRHRMAGNIFVVSMLCMCVAAVYMATMKSEPSNILAGIFTAYLVATAWLTAKRSDGKKTIFDALGLGVALAALTAYVLYGLEAANSPSGAKAGVPAGMYFVMGFIALLAAVGDFRLLLGGALSATQRLVRHLWRMFFALFIASGSLFLARPHLFPAVLRQTGVIVLLGFLPLILMIFWLIRVRFTRAQRKVRPTRTEPYLARA